MREGGDGARPVCRLVQMGAPRVARGRHSQSSTLEHSSAIVTTAWNPVDGLPSSGSPGRRRWCTRFVTIVPDQPSPTSLVFAKSLMQCSLCRPGRSSSILRTISALNLSMHLGDRCFSSSSSDFQKNHYRRTLPQLSANRFFVLKCSYLPKAYPLTVSESI